MPLGPTATLAEQPTEPVEPVTFEADGDRSGRDFRCKTEPRLLRPSHDFAQRRRRQNFETIGLHGFDGRAFDLQQAGDEIPKRPHRFTSRGLEVFAEQRFVERLRALASRVFQAAAEQVESLGAPGLRRLEPSVQLEFGEFTVVLDPAQNGAGFADHELKHRDFLVEQRQDLFLDRTSRPHPTTSKTALRDSAAVRAPHQDICRSKKRPYASSTRRAGFAVK